MAEQLFADRYELGRSLGAGGMSTVRLAFDTRLERNVAVKLLAEHLAHDSGFVTRFRREALAAARMMHPNVVQVFDFGLDPATERQYIVMEHIDGRSCSELLREHGALEPSDAVDILTQSCRGLDYAHRNGVIHRDVKPGNLLRSRDGQVKLADFGIAKAAEQSDITKVGSVLGTAAYLSPEQTRGEPAGPASDLYALGVVAFQLLTGRLPYEANSLTDLARQQDAGPPRRPDEVNPAVPRELADAVMRALAPDPADRYPGAAEMETALRNGLAGISPAATAATRAREDLDSTRVVGGGTDVTRAMPAQRRRQPLQPIPAPPRERIEPQRRREPDPAPASRRRERRRAPNRWRGLKLFVYLLLVLALVAGGVFLYQELAEPTLRAVELGEQISGDVQQAVEQLRDLIESNIR